MKYRHRHLFLQVENDCLKPFKLEESCPKQLHASLAAAALKTRSMCHITTLHTTLTSNDPNHSGFFTPGSFGAVVSKLGAKPKIVSFEWMWTKKSHSSWNAALSSLPMEPWRCSFVVWKQMKSVYSPMKKTVREAISSSVIHRYELLLYCVGSLKSIKKSVTVITPESLLCMKQHAVNLQFNNTNNAHISHFFININFCQSPQCDFPMWVLTITKTVQSTSYLNKRTQTQQYIIFHELQVWKHPEHIIFNPTAPLDTHMQVD